MLTLVCVVIPVIISCYWLAPISIIVIVFISGFSHVFLKSSTKIKRIEAVSRSMTFQHTYATVQGLTTIRAMNLQSLFSSEFNMHSNNYTSVSFASMAIMRWLGTTVECICQLYISVVVITMTLIDSDASDLGLAVSSANQLLFTTQHFVTSAAQVAIQMTSVERVAEYTQLEAEAELDTLELDKQVADDTTEWPTCGKIEFQKVSAKYSSSTLLSLRNISCVIQPYEKIGIVGRTGAGKSSFLNVLFRIIEPQGEILIDGRDICQMGLHNLRKKISIIPQDPILFAGTMRMNVDPFTQYSDEQILQALEDVQLRHLVDTSQNGLMSHVTAGGSNLSVGERQLMCLARAILRDNKILVMDEATASVDQMTDDLIQKTIRLRFKKCTVLTIAHRLNTIIDADKIMVLSDGELVEFDAPHMLLKNQDGHFSKLVHQTGPQQRILLTNIAFKSC